MDMTTTTRLTTLITTVVASIGAVNWGLIAAYDFDLVAFLFGYKTLYARIVYGIVGVAGLYLFIRSFTGLCYYCKAHTPKAL